MLVSDRLALVDRWPPPRHLLCYELEPHVSHEASAGLFDRHGYGSGAQLTANVMLNAGTLSTLPPILHVAVGLVHRVDDADDVLELGLVVRVQDRLVELPICRVRVLSLGLPLGLDFRREIRETDDLSRPLVR